MLLLQAPAATVGCEAGALQEDTESASREAAANQAASVESCPDVPLEKEIAWTETRLSEDDAGRRSAHSAGIFQSPAAFGESCGVQGRVERVALYIPVKGMPLHNSQQVP